MANDHLTHHERVLAHLRNATKALEAHRADVEAAQRAHAQANPVVTSPPATAPESEAAPHG